MRTCTFFYTAVVNVPQPVLTKVIGHYNGGRLLTAGSLLYFARFLYKIEGKLRFLLLKQRLYFCLERDAFRRTNKRYCRKWISYTQCPFSALLHVSEFHPSLISFLSNLLKPSPAAPAGRGASFIPPAILSAKVGQKESISRRHTKVSISFLFLRLCLAPRITSTQLYPSCP